MGASAQPMPEYESEKRGEPARSASGMPPLRTVSTRDWDPGDPIFDQNVVADLQERLRTIQAQITEQRDYLDGLGPQGLIGPSAEVDVPGHWPETRGHPAYYLNVAQGYVHAAIQGTICRKAHPPASRAEHPPPAGQWCCEHVPPHCEK